MKFRTRTLILMSTAFLLGQASAQIPTKNDLPVRSIGFAANRADLSQHAQIELKKVAHFLLAYPQKQLILTGYVTTQASKINLQVKKENLEFGRQRALAVKTWLLQQGIEQHRINVTASVVPLPSTSHAEARKLRRVALSLIQ